MLAEGRIVLFVSNHADTADLYSYALEQAGYRVKCVADMHAAITAAGTPIPLAIVVHLLPRHDPVAVGALLRQGRPSTVIIGLISMQLSIDALKRVLGVFDDVVMIPCTPDALVSRVVGLERVKRRQASA